MRGGVGWSWVGGVRLEAIIRLQYLIKQELHVENNHYQTNQNQSQHNNHTPLHAICIKEEKENRKEKRKISS